MSQELSVAAVLAQLEAQIAHHREREAFHAQQEGFHHEQRALHAAELERVSSHFASFKTAAEAAVEIVRAAAAPPAPADDSDLPAKPLVSRLVARAVEAVPAGESFGATSIAAEVNRRFAARLRRPVNARTVAVKLRRLRNAGTIRQVREGVAFHETLYTRG